MLFRMDKGLSLKVYLYYYQPDSGGNLLILPELRPHAVQFNDCTGWVICRGEIVWANGRKKALWLCFAHGVNALTDKIAFNELATLNEKTWQGVDEKGQIGRGLAQFKLLLHIEPIEPLTLERPRGAVVCCRLTAEVTHPAFDPVTILWFR